MLLLITSEIGGICRFNVAKEVMSYTELDSAVRESDGSQTESISKQKNRNIRWILIQCVNTAIRRCNNHTSDASMRG